MEDNFSIGGGHGSGGNVGDGERQMKPRSLAHCSPPAVWPGPLLVRSLGVGVPCLN